MDPNENNNQNQENKERRGLTDRAYQYYRDYRRARNAFTAGRIASRLVYQLTVQLAEAGASLLGEAGPIVLAVIIAIAILIFVVMMVAGLLSSGSSGTTNPTTAPTGAPAQFTLLLSTEQTKISKGNPIYYHIILLHEKTASSSSVLPFKIVTACIPTGAIYAEGYNPDEHLIKDVTGRVLGVSWNVNELINLGAGGSIVGYSNYDVLFNLPLTLQAQVDNNYIINQAVYSNSVSNCT